MPPCGTFVNGLQKVTFPLSPALQAIWLPAFAMTGLAPVSKRYPSPGTLLLKDSTSNLLSLDGFTVEQFFARQRDYSRSIFIENSRYESWENKSHNTGKWGTFSDDLPE
ncbi:hypothetical protein MTYM_01434 [Methylococcales bacterium]|nr:hypothetical protein MTYM_01434 [Methylococcales bacterium]